MNKKSIGIFCVSVVLTALFLSLLISLIMIEHNTLKLGFGGNTEIFSLESNRLIINGREYFFPLKEALGVLETKAAKFVVAVFIAL